MAEVKVEWALRASLYTQARPDGKVQIDLIGSVEGRRFRSLA
jgi:hypothetical protein